MSQDSYSHFQQIVASKLHFLAVLTQDFLGLLNPSLSSYLFEIIIPSTLRNLRPIVNPDKKLPHYHKKQDWKVD